MSVAVPKLKRDWIGRQVHLKRQIETRGGIIFNEGEVMNVAAYYQGLTLEAISTCQHCRRRSRQIVTRISINEVELLPEQKP